MYKAHLERTIFPVIVAITGVALILQLLGVFLPYWYKIRDNDYGLWMSRTCNPDCNYVWYSDSASDIRGVLESDTLMINCGFQTTVLILGLIGIIASLIQLANRSSTPLIKGYMHTVFFTSTLLAGFIAETGILLFVSDAHAFSLKGFCHIFPAIAGFLWLSAAVISCVLCRYQAYDDEDTIVHPVSSSSTRF